MLPWKPIILLSFEEEKIKEIKVNDLGPTSAGEWSQKQAHGYYRIFCGRSPLSFFFPIMQAHFYLFSFILVCTSYPVTHTHWKHVFKEHPTTSKLNLPGQSSASLSSIPEDAYEIEASLVYVRRHAHTQTHTHPHTHTRIKNNLCVKGKGGIDLYL